MALLRGILGSLEGVGRSMSLRIGFESLETYFIPSMFSASCGQLTHDHQVSCSGCLLPFLTHRDALFLWNMVFYCNNINVTSLDRKWRNEETLNVLNQWKCNIGMTDIRWLRIFQNIIIHIHLGVIDLDKNSKKISGEGAISIIASCNMR